jgi:hypothetical protein
MTLEKRVQAFVAALTHHQPFVEPFDALVAESKHSTPLERDAAIGSLLAWENDHAELTGYTCIASGALVEDGGSTLTGLDTILDRLAAGTELLASIDLDDVDLDAHVSPPSELSRDVRRWIAGWKSHVRGAMARLARDPRARKRLRAHERLVNAVRILAENTYAHHLRYITEIVDMLDDEPLHVIDLCNGGAVQRYRAFGVRNGFHLMTLLDGGDPLAIVNREQDFFAAKHSWYSWPALAEKDGRFVADGLMSLLWGEPPAAHLPMFEGVRTIIRAPLGMQRSWGTSLISPIHDALHEHLVLEHTLPPIEARPLLSRIVQSAYTLTNSGESA